jgi:hypothetical protein
MFETPEIPVPSCSAGVACYCACEYGYSDDGSGAGGRVCVSGGGEVGVGRLIDEA